MTSSDVVVTFFPSTAPASAAASCCGPDGSCGPTTVSLSAPVTVESLTEAVVGHFEGKVDVQVASYQTESGVDAAIAGLNEVLRASGKKFEVTPVNFYTFVESVAPIVAVGDQILTIRQLPDWDELRNAIEKVHVTV